MKSNSIVTGVYALFVLIGGIIGYTTADSIPSLAMGTVFALLLAGCAKLIWDKKSAGYVGAIVLMGVLLAFFGYRFILSTKFMPAGLMTILSLVAMSALLSKRPELKES